MAAAETNSSLCETLLSYEIRQLLHALVVENKVIIQRVHPIVEKDRDLEYASRSSSDHTASQIPTLIRLMDLRAPRPQWSSDLRSGVHWYCTPLEEGHPPRQL